ncbi:MAG: hypothetical protein ACXVA9_09185 [Bdellovibrionales bacterium]
MKLALAFLALTIGSSAFATSVTYDCVNKKDKTDLATLVLNDQGDSTINGESFGDTPKVLDAMSPENYPVQVRKGQIVAEIQEMGDGDTIFTYAVLPSNWNQRSLIFTVVEDNQRPATDKWTWTDYRCVRK